MNHSAANFSGSSSSHGSAKTTSAAYGGNTLTRRSAHASSGSRASSAASRASGSQPHSSKTMSAASGTLARRVSTRSMCRMEPMTAATARVRYTRRPVTSW